MFVLGITGGIGSGKSTVSGMLRDRGVLVLDADEISKLVTSANGIALPSIVEEFGPKALNSDGSMNRKYMSNLVFSDNTKLDKLSSIVHKHVFEYISNAIEDERSKGTKAIVLDVPIPVNNGFVNRCNQIWVVTCDEETRVKRLIARGLTEDDAKRRIMVQMTDEEYLSIGNVEVNNSGELNALEQRVNELIQKEFHGRGIRI